MTPFAVIPNRLMLQSAVRVDRDDEAGLAYAPLLLALDDGTRYVRVHGIQHAL